MPPVRVQTEPSLGPLVPSGGHARVYLASPLQQAHQQQVHAPQVHSDPERVTLHMSQVHVPAEHSAARVCVRTRILQDGPRCALTSHLPYYSRASSSRC